MRNLELKFRCADPGMIRTRAAVLGAEDGGRLWQRDTFFPAELGRLKLRDFGDGAGELIAYRRPDSTEARGSDYLLANLTDPDALRRVMSFGLGEAGTVRKQRRLFLWRHTRIHLDEVEGLGDFVELETVIVEQTEDAAHEELRLVVEALGLRDQDRIARAYVDLLNDRDSH
ncbi:MAG: class IV adenylate cyclase [Actinomycetota bacterium]